MDQVGLSCVWTCVPCLSVQFSLPLWVLVESQRCCLSLPCLLSSVIILVSVTASERLYKIRIGHTHVFFGGEILSRIIGYKGIQWDRCAVPRLPCLITRLINTRHRRMITLVQINQWDFHQPAVECRCATSLSHSTEQKQTIACWPK